MARFDKADGLFAALGMHGSPHRLGESAGAPMPDDFFDLDSVSYLEWLGELSNAQLERLRVALWRQARIVYFDNVLVSGALTFRWIDDLVLVLFLAERHPEATIGRPYARCWIAKAWRTWLRLRGLSHRIRWRPEL